MTLLSGSLGSWTVPRGMNQCRLDQAECACWNDLDHTCGGAGDGSIITVWCRRRHCCCVCGMPATAVSSVPATAHGCIFGACDTAEARGFGRAAPRDTSCPVATQASILLLVLLWPPLSQQQRPSPAVLIAPTLQNALRSWRIRSTRSEVVGCALKLGRDGASFCSPGAPDKLRDGSPALSIPENLQSIFEMFPKRLCLNDMASVLKLQQLQLQENEYFHEQ